MGIDITQKPEMNVVNVGDEVTSDQIAAIQNAAAPTAANPFATIADVGGGNPFDQSLNTSDSPMFWQITSGGGIFIDATATSAITFPDSTVQNTAYTGPQNPFDQSLSTSDSVAFLGVSTADATQGSYLTISGISALDFTLGGPPVGVEVSVTAGINISKAGLGITFPDGSVQSTAASGGLPTPSGSSQPYPIVWNSISNTWDSAETTGWVQFFIDQAGAYQAFAAAWGPSGGPSVAVTLDGFVTSTEVTGSGIKFPDGSLQTTAAGGGGSGLTVIKDYVGNWNIADYFVNPNEYAVAYDGGYVNLDNLTTGDVAYIANLPTATNNLQIGASTIPVFFGNGASTVLSAGQVAKVIGISSGPNEYHVIVLC